MKVLTFTSLYPNNQEPLLGIFNQERVKALSEFCEVKVVAPVPYFPAINVNKKWYAFSQVTPKEYIEDTEILHPRKFVTPKVGMELYGLFYFISALGCVRKLQRRFDFDIIDTHFAYPDGFASVMLGRMLKKPVILTVHGNDVNLYSKFRFIRKYLSYTFNNAGRIITVSNALKNKVAQLGISEKKIKFISNGVDIEKFHSVNREAARNELGLPLDSKIIVSVGMLIELKGFKYLIDAISLMKHKMNYRNIALVIIGEGPLRYALECQIKKLNLESQVRLVGMIPHNELYKWHSAADLFALASSSEGWPTVFFEAFACGKPVVATRIEGTSEVISSEDYGLLTEKQEAEEFACKIDLALDKKWDTQKIIDYAAQNTWKAKTKILLTEFEEVISEHATMHKYSSRQSYE